METKKETKNFLDKETKYFVDKVSDILLGIMAIVFVVILSYKFTYQYRNPKVYVSKLIFCDNRNPIYIKTTEEPKIETFLESYPTVYTKETTYVNVCSVSNISTESLFKQSY